MNLKIKNIIYKHSIVSQTQFKTTCTIKYINPITGQIHKAKASCTNSNIDDYSMKFGHKLAYHRAKLNMYKSFYDWVWLNDITVRNKLFDLSKKEQSKIECIIAKIAH